MLKKNVRRDWARNRDPQVNSIKYRDEFKQVKAANTSIVPLVGEVKSDVFLGKRTRIPDVKFKVAKHLAHDIILGAEIFDSLKYLGLWIGDHHHDQKCKYIGTSRKLVKGCTHKCRETRGKMHLVPYDKRNSDVIDDQVYRF